MLSDLANDALVDKFLGTDLRTRFKFRQIADVDRCKLLLEYGIGETPLRNAAMQWHLSAFETALLAAARPRPHAFVAARSRLSVPASGAPPDALRLMCRSRIRP